MPYDDPFAKAVENKTETPKAEPADVEVTEETTAEGMVVTTFKLSGSHDAPWIVTHAKSIAEARAIQTSTDFKSHLAHTFIVWKYIRESVESEGLGAASKASGGSGGAGGREARPNPPGVPEVACAHGPRAYVSKANWSALFCGAPEGTPDNQKCEPHWKQKDGSFAPNTKR